MRVLRIEAAGADLSWGADPIALLDLGEGGASTVGPEGVTLLRDSPFPAGPGEVTLVRALRILGRFPGKAEPERASAAGAVDRVLRALAERIAGPVDRFVGPVAAAAGVDLARLLGQETAAFPPDDDLVAAHGRETDLLEIAGWRPFSLPVSRLGKASLAHPFKLLSAAGVLRLQALGTPGGAIRLTIRLDLRAGDQERRVEVPMPLLRAGDPAALAAHAGVEADLAEITGIGVTVVGRVRAGRGKAPPPWSPPGVAPLPAVGPAWVERRGAPVWVPAGARAEAVEGGGVLVRL